MRHLSSVVIVREINLMFLARSGGDLLSHVLGRSTIGATALNCRVRYGIGCFARAVTTKPREEHHRHVRAANVPIISHINPSLVHMVYF